MVRLINLTGTSLLINRLSKYFMKVGSYQEDFLNCLDEEAYNKLSLQKRREIKNLLPLLNEDREEDLINLLTIPYSTRDLPFLSAETKTIELILREERINPGDVEIVFIASNTVECRACAEALKRFYERDFSASVRIVKKLSSRTDCFEEGLKELTNIIVELSRKTKTISDILVNATAGFKPESSYATISGLLTDLKIYYGHEQFNKVVRLPAMPVGVDFSQIHNHASKIILALETGNINAYSELPIVLQEMLTSNGDGYELTYSGSILWQKYLDNCNEFNIPGSKWLLTEKIDDKVLHNRLISYISAWDHIWVGMQVPQMVDHGQSHCQNMLGLGEQLLVQLPGDFLNQEEVYLLIAAIWLHDIGHSEPVIIEEGDTPRWLKPSEIRKLHHLLSYQRIKYEPEYFGFDCFDNEAELIALLCKYHNTLDINSIELEGEKKLNGKKVRLKLLIGLLRLLDASDIGIRRVGDDRYRTFRQTITEREITKYKQLANLTEDKEAKNVFGDEVAFRKIQGKHFQAHALIDSVALKVVKTDETYTVNVVLYPAPGAQDYMETVENIVGFAKINNAREIIKKQTDGVIKNIHVVEA